LSRDFCARAGIWDRHWSACAVRIMHTHL
jgi:hypothetical protein